MNLLLSEGHSASRINTTGIYDEAAESWRRSGSRKGFFDIVCSLRPHGRFFAIDTKSGKDKASDDQLKFQKEVEATNGIAIFVSTYSEFLNYYRNILGY